MPATFDSATGLLSLDAFPETAEHRLYDSQARGARYDIDMMLSFDAIC